MNTQSADAFQKAFQKRHECCRALLELSYEQHDCITNNDTTRLLEVLASKQRILTVYQDLREQHPHLADQWKQCRHAVPQEIQLECDQMLEQSEALLGELIDHEQRCSEKLTASKLETERQLRMVTAGAAAHNSYQEEHFSTQPQHLDINQ